MRDGARASYFFVWPCSSLARGSLFDMQTESCIRKEKTCRSLMTSRPNEQCNLDIGEPLT